MRAKQQRPWSRLLQEESGAASVEYGVMVACLGIGLIAAILALKAPVTRMFSSVGGTVELQGK